MKGAYSYSNPPSNAGQMAGKGGSWTCIELHCPAPPSMPAGRLVSLMNLLSPAVALCRGGQENSQIEDADFAMQNFAKFRKISQCTILHKHTFQPHT